MEMVVGVSKFVGTREAEALLAEWVQGYADAGGRLCPAERALVPDLIVVRILSNVIYFAGRAWAGEDSIEPLTSRAEMYAERIRWCAETRDWIVALLDEKLAE